MDSLDLRKPTGILFVLLGALLGVYGMVSRSMPLGSSVNLNLNLLWGGVMFVSGCLLLLLARRKRIISSPGPGPDHLPK